MFCFILVIDNNKKNLFTSYQQTYFVCVEVTDNRYIYLCKLQIIVIFCYI